MLIDRACMKSVAARFDGAANRVGFSDFELESGFLAARLASQVAIEPFDRDDRRKIVVAINAHDSASILLLSRSAIVGIPNSLQTRAMW